MATRDNPFYARTTVLRAYWDDEATPSVEAPIGDFFGIGHGIVKDFWSLPLSMSPQDGRGFNCFFPMPFASRARIEVENESDAGMIFFFYVDYEEHDRLDEGLGRFHAQWRRENPTQGWAEGRYADDPAAGQFGELRKKVWSTPNLDGKDNYVILEAEGRGHYVGCNLNIDCFSRQVNDWYGEGDDMIFIDGDVWPPTLHGTGTEDYFNTAFSPRSEFCAPYHGVTVYSGTPRMAVEGQELALPLPHRRPRDVREVNPRDHRARARQQPQQRLLQHGVLVPDRAARSLSDAAAGRPHACRGPIIPEVSRRSRVWIALPACDNMAV